MSGSRNIFKTVDWALVICYFILVAIGITNIYASIQSEDPASVYALSTRSGKQLMWFGLSLFVGVIVLFVISPRLWEVISTPAFVFVVFLLFAVIFLSSDIKGSHSWFSFGPIRFQPAEVSKITTSLLLAAVMSKPGFRFSRRSDLLSVAAVLGVPMMAILLEDETGSMLVYAGFFLVLYREGMSGWIIVAGLMAVVLFIMTLVTGRLAAMALLTVLVGLVLYMGLRSARRSSIRIKSKIWRLCGLMYLAGSALVFGTKFAFDKILAPHQRTRIEVLLGMKEDILGAGYNVHQSLIAIGSGGFFGKGYLQGTQTAYGFVPEQSTDFIFCTVGEEWGFLGCVFLIAVYAFLIFRIISDAEESRETFTRIYGYCLACCLIMHLFINIGMTVGLMPVIGIPLPFVSYGGSSLLAFTVMLFIFLALDRQEKKYF